MESNVNILDADAINEAVEKNDSNMINKIKRTIMSDDSKNKFYSNSLLKLYWLQKLTPKSIICLWEILVGKKYRYYRENEMFPQQSNIWQSLSVEQLNNLCNTEDYYENITNFIQKNYILDFGVFKVDYIDTQQCNLGKYFGEPIVTSQGFTSYPFYKIDPFWDNDFDNKWSSLDENAKKLLFRYAVKQLFIICNNVANRNEAMQSFESLGGLLNSISFLIKKYNVDDDLSVYADISVIWKLAQNAYFSNRIAIYDKNKILECLNALAKFKQLGTKFQNTIKRIIGILRDTKKIDQNINFEFYLDEIKNLNPDSIITKFDKNWFSDRQICSQVLRNLSYQQINGLVNYKSNDKSGSEFISKLLKTVCWSEYNYDESSGDFLEFDKKARHDFFDAKQIKKLVPILVDVVENNMQTLDLKTEEKNVMEYKFVSGDKFKNLSSEAKNLFVTTLLNSFLDDLRKTDKIYQSYHKNSCLPPNEMLAAINECYINFSEVLKSFSKTDNNNIKIDLDVLEELIFQLFARDENRYLKSFLTKLMDLSGLNKSFVDYVKNILPLCDSTLLDENCEYADIVNDAVKNKNEDQIDFIKKLMKREYSCFFHRDDHNFIKKLSYDAVITFGEHISSYSQNINYLSKDIINRIFKSVEHRQILEKALKRSGDEFSISFNKSFGHNDEILTDYEFMEFGNPEQAQELPAWLLKINENDSLQDDNFPQFTFQTLIIPDNVDSVFIAHDINVRINKFLKKLLNDVQNGDNKQENADKYIDTEKMREVFINIYCLIRKYAQHHLEVRIDKEIINSMVEKTKKEDINYLVTCFGNFSSFLSFGKITQSNFSEAKEKCLGSMGYYNSNDFLRKLENDRNFANTIFLSDKIQKLSIQSLITKRYILKTRPDCIFYLSNQQINSLAVQQNGLELIKGFIVNCQEYRSEAKIFESQNEIVQISGQNHSISRFHHIEKKLEGINSVPVKKILVDETVKYLLTKLGKSISVLIGTGLLFNHAAGSRYQLDTIGCITKTFDSIYVLMQNPAVTHDLNIEIDYFLLATLANKIPTADRQFYLQQLERIIELPGWASKTLYYLKQIINFLSFDHLFSQNSLMAKIRNNPQNPVPQMENDNLNIQQ